MFLFIELSILFSISISAHIGQRTTNLCSAALLRNQGNTIKPIFITSPGICIHLHIFFAFKIDAVLPIIFHTTIQQFTSQNPF